MTSSPPTSILPVSEAAAAPGSPDAMARQWLALHRAAAAVATLAGSPPSPLTIEIAQFPQLLARAGGWRQGLARQGVADLASVMEPGLTALIAVHDRGANPQPAAHALLQEFSAARDALLTLAPRA